MNKTQISALLKQRNESWYRYHQLRRNKPVNAAIARRTALKVEQILSEAGVEFDHKRSANQSVTSSQLSSISSQLSSTSSKNSSR